VKAKLSATALPAGETAKERFHPSGLNEPRDDHDREQARRSHHRCEQGDENVRHQRAISCVPFERAQRTTVI